MGQGVGFRSSHVDGTYLGALDRHPDELSIRAVAFELVHAHTQVECVVVGGENGRSSERLRKCLAYVKRHRLVVHVTLDGGWVES